MPDSPRSIEPRVHESRSEDIACDRENPRSSEPPPLSLMTPPPSTQTPAKKTRRGKNRPRSLKVPNEKSILKERGRGGLKRALLAEYAARNIVHLPDNPSQPPPPPPSAPETQPPPASIKVRLSRTTPRIITVARRQTRLEPPHRSAARPADTRLPRPGRGSRAGSRSTKGPCPVSSEARGNTKEPV